MARPRRPAVSVPDDSNLASGQHRKIAAQDVISTKESTVVAQMRGQPVVYDLGLATSTFIAWPRPRWRPRPTAPVVGFVPEGSEGLLKLRLARRDRAIQLGAFHHPCDLST